MAGNASVCFCACRYITVTELDAVPSYMRSRLTLDKVTQWPDSSCISATQLPRKVMIQA